MMKHTIMKTVAICGLLLCVFCACAKETQSASDVSVAAAKVSAEKLDKLSEQEIFADIQKEDENFASYGLTLSSGEVTQRQTDQNKRTDRICCKVDAANEILSYHAAYELRYFQTDGEWVLEECRQTDSTYQPLNAITQADADAAMAAAYGDYTYVSEEAAENRHVFYYTAAAEQGPVRGTYDVSLVYVFDMNGWSLAEQNAAPTEATAGDLALLETMVVNVWDNSVQTEQIMFFLRNGYGMLRASAGRGFVGEISWFTYTVENAVVTINHNRWAESWSWNSELGSFEYQLDEGNFGISVMTVQPTPVGEFFGELAAVENRDVHDDEYFDSVMEQLLFYDENTVPEEEYAAIAQAQEVWQTNLDQQAASQGVDFSTARGAVWRTYHIKNRVCELLGMAVDASNPPVYNQPPALEEARRIAERYFARAYAPNYDYGWYIEEQAEQNAYYFTLIDPNKGAVAGFFVDAVTGDYGAMSV